MHKDANLGVLADAVEAVSSRYAERFGIHRTPDWCLLKLAEDLGELTQAHLRRSGQARTEGLSSDLDRRFEAEMADVLGQLLVLAKLSGTNLFAALDRKWLQWHPDRLSQEEYHSAPLDTSPERMRGS